MKRCLDLFRAVFISPELLMALVPFAVHAYWREPAVFFTEQFSNDVKAIFTWALVPAGFLVATYKFGGDILSPQGTRRILLDWPGYYMLKERVVLALVSCVTGLVLGLAGAFVVARYKSILGATLIFAGILSSGASLATVAIARFRIREIFRG